MKVRFRSVHRSCPGGLGAVKTWFASSGFDGRSERFRSCALFPHAERTVNADFPGPLASDNRRMHGSAAWRSTLVFLWRSITVADEQYFNRSMGVFVRADAERFAGQRSL